MKVMFDAGFGAGRVFAPQDLNADNRVFYKRSFISPVDAVSFSGNIEAHKINVDTPTAEFVANSLSTSTSGHRAPYGSKTFNPEVVELITLGVAICKRQSKRKRRKTPCNTRRRYKRSNKKISSFD